MRSFALALVLAYGAPGVCDTTTAEDGMRGWTARCKALLERARVELGTGDAAFAAARTTIEGDAVLLSVTDGGAMRSVRVTPTSPTSPARNNWNPPRDQWVDLPIIDKSYSTQKLNLFRWSEKLEGSITAHRSDDSPRAPPVPKWLERFVELFKRAVEDCLR
ncbi:MAG: hypothetical protein ACXVDD_15560 [Polyangia bacterium]